MSFKSSYVMSLKNLFIVTFSLILFQQSFSQRNYEGYNKLGISAGITLFDITTSDFNTRQGEGFIAGFTSRGSFRNNFDLIYGMTFLNTKIGILGYSSEGTTGGFDQQYMNYSISGIQLNFLGSYNIVRHHLSLEFGPILNINGKMKLDSEQYEDYVIDGFETTTATDIEDISKVNFHFMGGITAGIEGLRISGQYQYGVTNVLNKLNDTNSESDSFKGHSSMLVIALVLYF